MFFCSTLNKLKDASAFATYSNDLFSHVFMYQSYAYVVIIGIKLNQTLFPIFDDFSLALWLDFLADHSILA